MLNFLHLIIILCIHKRMPRFLEYITKILRGKGACYPWLAGVWFRKIKPCTPICVHTSKHIHMSVRKEQEGGNDGANGKKINSWPSRTGVYRNSHTILRLVCKFDLYQIKIINKQQQRITCPSYLTWTFKTSNQRTRGSCLQGNSCLEG